MRKVKATTTKTRKNASRRRLKRFGNWRFWVLAKGGATGWGRWLRMGFVALVIGAPTVAWFMGYPQMLWDGLVNGTLTMSSRLGLSVKEIYLEGRHGADRQELLDIIGLKKGDPILSASPQEIRQRLEASPWVRYAAVERQLPGVLWVGIEERIPVAVWQHQQKFYLIDDQNIVIAPHTGPIPEKYPLIVGKDAPLYGGQLLKILERFPEIRKRVSSLVYVSQRRWNIILDGTVEVRLPAKDYGRALMRLDILIKEKKLDPQEMYSVDLRMSDRMVIRLSPTASTRLKIKGKET